MSTFATTLCIVSLLIHAVCSQINSNGCMFDSSQGVVTCDFKTWNPPLNDSQFNQDVTEVIVKNVNGAITDGVFCGLRGPTSGTLGRTPGIHFQCNLEDIILSPNTFTSNLDWVKTLTFQNCYIRNGISSNMLKSLTTLETLNISSGIVGPLSDESFAGLSNLKTLAINSDLINHVLPVALFQPLASIEVIDLRTSGISSLSPGIFLGLQNLKTLDLSRNSLTSLPAGLFKSLSSLQEVRLGMNSWDCTCDMAWISTWSLYSGISLGITCSTPASLSGLTLNRALLSLGCSSLQQTSENTDTESTASDIDDLSLQLYGYIATGLAGLACVISGILACVLCYMCYNVKHPNTDSKQTRYTRSPRVSAVSRLDHHRPPSYNSAERLEVPSPDRLFIPSPKLPRHNRKDGPYIDVVYSTDF